MKMKQRKLLYLHQMWADDEEPALEFQKAMDFPCSNLNKILVKSALWHPPLLHLQYQMRIHAKFPNISPQLALVNQKMKMSAYVFVCVCACVFKLLRNLERTNLLF